MEQQRYLELIRRLCNARGASGFEDEVVAVAAQWCAPFASCRETSIRNLYLTPKNHKGDGRPVIMLDAHGDEVGLVVQFINPNGTLSFLKLGGFAPHSLVGQKVWVRNAAGRYVTGVIASKPPHFMSEAERAAGASDESLVIDIGAASAQDAKENYLIRIGEPAVPAVELEYDEAHDRIFSKALDCRIGCAAMIATLERLAGEDLPCDLTGTITAQEEVGERGAVSAARTVRPAAAIVFEGAPADDTFTPEHQIQTALGKGPMLRYVDCSMISNPRFTRFALDLAEELGIPVQASVRSGGGTNGSVIHMSGDSVPVIVLGVPVRYIHSPHGVSCYHDFAAAVDLAAALCRRLTPERIAGF